MNSNPQSDRTIDNNQSEESSMKVHAAPESVAHARLARVVRQCMGWSPSLQSGLRVLDDATAAALATMLEQQRAEAERSRHGGWVRGFSAGQQS
jgi:hypothetical protein